MKTSDLLGSIYSDLNQHTAKLKTLGRTSNDESRLSLDSPEGLARYAQIMRPNILATLHANRTKGRLVIACLLILLALACYLALRGNTNNLNWLRATAIPGLGVAAWWPIAVLVRLRREDVALQLLPDLLPLLPPKDAAEVLKKMLLSSLSPSEGWAKAASVVQAVVILCFALAWVNPSHVWAQEGARVEPRAEAEQRARDELIRKDSAKAKESAIVAGSFRGEPSPALRDAFVGKAMQDGRWDEPEARAHAIWLVKKYGGRDTQGGAYGNFVLRARAFLEFSDGRLLNQAKRSNEAGDLKHSAFLYRELLSSPQLDWETRSYVQRAARDLSFTEGFRSYQGHAWGEAAQALSEYLDRADAADLRNKESIEMLAKSLMEAGTAAYARQDWWQASRFFGEFTESSTGKGAGWNEFHKYIRSVPGMHEAASLYVARSQHFSEAEKMPHGAAVIEVMPHSHEPVDASTGHSYTFHVFDRSGDVDVIVSGRNLQEAISSIDLQHHAADSPAISSIVLTQAAQSTAEASLETTTLFPGAVVWHARSIREASENLRTLEESHPSVRDFSLAMLLPKNEDQKQKLGLSDWSVEDQKRTWESAQQFIAESKISDIITEKVNRGGVIGNLYEFFDATQTQRRLFEALTQKKNVLIFIAHGDREHLYTPDGRSVSVRDIKNLDLKNNRPAIFLFSCEGGKRGKSDAGPALADALKEAGAGMVWSFEEKVDAGEAMSAASGLLFDVNGGKSMLEAVRSLAQNLYKMGAPRVHLRVHINLFNEGLLGRNENQRANGM